MAKRDPQPGGSARSRQRGKPVQVQAKRPWGAIIGAAVLGLALIGVLAFAVLNAGEGFRDPVDTADSSIDGVLVSEDSELGRNHVSGPVDYEQTPPNGGDHNAQPQTCAVYEEEIADEHAVHSMEHGAVWITYKPDLPDAQVETLRGLAEGESYVLMSPYPDQEAPVELSAWGRTLEVESADDDRVEDFVDTYANGPQTPEKGAACQGTSATGPLTGAPAPTAPVTPAPSAAVTAPASPVATPAS